MGRLIAIGDIHGCYYSMINLLSKINYCSASDTIVFVGDYIDRGKNSYQVVTQLQHLQNQVGSDKVICLLGNHEQMAIDALENNSWGIWEMNGAHETTTDFNNHSFELENAVEWFHTLPVVYDTPEIIFCHAGLSYPSLSDNIKDDLLWGRNWIKTESRPREKQVIFGHTPRRTWEAYTTGTGDICIDAGCVFGGNLCALILNKDGSTEIVYVKKSRKD